MLRSVACVFFVVLLAASGLSAQEAAEAPEPDSTTNKGEASRQTQQSVCLLLKFGGSCERTAGRIFRPINLAGKSKSEMISRRGAFSLLGLAAALSFVVPATVMTATDAALAIQPQP